MEILNSDWLIYMLKKSSKTPHGRMLALFDILADWLNAPGLSSKAINAQFRLDSKCSALQSYLSIEAAHAGAAQPEMLATQLILMAGSACRSNLDLSLENNSHAGAGEALKHAKSAANALIAAQTRREFHIAKSTAYGIAASFVATLVIGGSLFVMHHNDAVNSPQIALANHPTISTVAIANPEDTAALIAQIELMRQGSCQLPEALQLPDSYKKVYFENIVSGQISTDPTEQKLVRQLLKSVRCNYTPMLMANSRG